PAFSNTNKPASSESLVSLNAGEAQINEGELGNKDGHTNQRIPNGQGGARNTSTYTQDTPTPGTENGEEVPPPPAISILDARNAPVSELVTVSGVLTVSDQFSGSAYLQDSTGGIAIFDELVHGDGVFMIGDSITVTGTRSVFNDQVQIGPVASVENNGLPNVPITPLTITLDQLSQHPAELVRIVDPSFPTPGDILFGNSNYILTDASGPGELRIDNDVAEIVGLGQPETCAEVIGVVGRFFEIYQLLPRQAADIACAGPYEPPVPPIDIPTAQTLDVVTWNIEWFGDESNSPPAGDPNSDAIQKAAAKQIIIDLDADIYTVQEISDDVLFEELVNELPGYEFVLSEAVSRPNEPGVKQKIGFIYNTATVSMISTSVLLESIHPLYNGGDDSALVGYPSTTDRFFASGRLPFLMVADVTLNGETEQYNFVALHARANSGTDAQNRYDMRKYDVEVLKDSLDANFPNANLILLGDYNDDVDETVADIPSTITSYEEYTSDPVNYNVVTRSLSDAGFRSFVFRENMIDHISVTDELYDNYIDMSSRVHYEFYDNTYTETASDHFPVSARFQIKAFDFVSISATDVSCNGAADGTASIVVSGGIMPYTYLWSDGQTTATAVGLSGGIYEVTVTDALGAEVMDMVLVEEPDALAVTTSLDTIVYLGYAPAECTTLEVLDITGGTGDYSVLWSTGETTLTIDVCPEETTAYTVTITDDNGCTVEATIVVEAIDITCGNNPYWEKVEICVNGITLCVPVFAVQAYLNWGATLGSCDLSNEIFITHLRVNPNPFQDIVSVRFEVNQDTPADIVLYDFYGNVVFQTNEQLTEGTNEFTYDLSNLNQGFYILKILVDGELKNVRLLVKY
ncbi:MAG: T9SS type A sorting domain-containing protein, partial [Bacteroidota bacterium]